MINHHFTPVKIEKQFVVYDSNIDLDNGLSHVISSPPTTDSIVTNIRPKYRIGFKNREVFSRSTV
jgi:hypothetical protein